MRAKQKKLSNALLQTSISRRKFLMGVAIGAGSLAAQAAIGPSIFKTEHTSHQAKAYIWAV